MEIKATGNGTASAPLNLNKETLAKLNTTGPKPGPDETIKTTTNPVISEFCAGEINIMA